MGHRFTQIDTDFSYTVPRLTLRDQLSAISGQLFLAPYALSLTPGPWPPGLTSDDGAFRRFSAGPE